MGQPLGVVLAFAAGLFSFLLPCAIGRSKVPPGSEPKSRVFALASE
jgi:hypothetical protein